MKLIDLYKEWMETGELPDNGLCNSIPKEYWEIFNLLRPSEDEKLRLHYEGFSCVYWAYDVPIGDESRKTALTPLRQTIVLLICAMKDEI